MDEQRDGKTEGGPDRPEVAVRRQCPGQDEKGEEGSRDSGVNGESTGGTQPWVYVDELDPAVDREHERKRQQRPFRPEIPGPGQCPDRDEQQREARRDRGMSGKRTAAGVTGDRGSGCLRAAPEQRARKPSECRRRYSREQDSDGEADKPGGD